MFGELRVFEYILTTGNNQLFEKCESSVVIANADSTPFEGLLTKFEEFVYALGIVASKYLVSLTVGVASLESSSEVVSNEQL